MGFVFALILFALVAFATEPVPIDITALSVLVALLLAEPVSLALVDAGLLDAQLRVIDTAEGLSGFASSATITVLAMFILSAGVQKTGVVQLLGAKLADLTGGSESKQLSAIIGTVTPLSGLINNTAAVAILLPMVTDLAHEGGNSPSKLLLPLSYASMFGGTLTLIGTSTNVLASELAVPYLGEPFSMFEFTALGVIVAIAGTIYLMTLGRWLTPARIPPEDDLTAEFELRDYLTEAIVREDSPLVGEQIGETLRETEFDVDVIQLIRGDEVFLEPFGAKTIQAGDVFALRTDRDTLVELLDAEGLDLADVTVDEAELELAESTQNLIEVVVAPGSFLVGESLTSANFRTRYNATVLAVRRGGDLVRRRLDNVRFRVGDTLLVQATGDSVDRLANNPDFIVAGEVERPDFRESKIPVAVALVLGVVAVAALTPIPIVVAALAGALGMVLTGCLDPGEVYDAVQWDVIILLAGVIPLGITMQNTGGAAFIAEGVVLASAGLPPLAVLGLLYLVTATLTNIISNNAAVVLMIPVAATVATEVGGDVFAFILAVTFAASTAFMTPVGYQTNLFVYGPGGYRFTDYLRVGTPLQLLFAVVTTLGIAGLYGVT
ncbi:SLC13 family permease [Halosegnis longus]|uniref:SLC13 family permease n=1 Tax=Halosegnis longus TaxID=2216012 RepID=UPI00129E78AF|nr:SLC13 family permease [Halosegnis longus]